MADSHAEDELPPELGHGDRLVDRVWRGWKEGNAKIQEWFTENAWIHDPQRYLGVVLEYVTQLLDNTGTWNRFTEIQQPADIEERYLPNLRAFSDQLFEIAKGHARRVADSLGPAECEAFELAVRTRLDARLEHWNAEALGYVREREVVRALSQVAKTEAHSDSDTAHALDQKGITWDNLRISFLSDERVQIWIGPKTETHNYAELGFDDARNGKPNKAWVTLRELAAVGGVIKDARNLGGDWSKVEKRVQEIRNALRKHFGISTDPVPFVSGTGYRALFKIDCSRPFKT